MAAAKFQNKVSKLEARLEAMNRSQREDPHVVLAKQDCQPTRPVFVRDQLPVSVAEVPGPTTRHDSCGGTNRRDPTTNVVEFPDRNYVQEQRHTERHNHTHAANNLPQSPQSPPGHLPGHMQGLSLNNVNPSSSPSHRSSPCRKPHKFQPLPGLGQSAGNSSPRRFLGLPSDPRSKPRHAAAAGHHHQRHSSNDMDQRLQEIRTHTNILTLNSVKFAADPDDLQLLGELGNGTSGHVVKMKHVKTNYIMAVKQMRKSGNKEENRRIMMDLEVVLKSHDCPYIVQCLGCFITQSDVWICMELMATCMDKLVKRLQEGVPEKILGKMAVATVNALHYLKEKHGVIHRDVKPSNILLDEKGTFKLCDFGISGRLVDSKAKTRGAGCAAYMAPERIDPPDPTKPDYDIRADVWSLGISLVELATGEFPYREAKTDFEVLTRVLEEDPPLLPIHQGFSMDFCAFVKDCLTKNYKQRPKYKKLIESPFIRRYKDMQVNVASWYAQVNQTALQSGVASSPDI